MNIFFYSWLSSLLFPLLSYFLFYHSFISFPLHPFYYSSPSYFHFFFLSLHHPSFLFFFLFTCFHTLTSLYAHIHFSLRQYFIFLSLIKSSFHLSSSSLSFNLILLFLFPSLSFNINPPPLYFLFNFSPMILLLWLLPIIKIDKHLSPHFSHTNTQP
ncbi:unnamed protein product [Acanthosepion pharaonis]|uniref:Uncharacterized protein n=1 Tax=Acanthosepion pharaonis TaxID=158019 RepID=A0A812DMY7_ACAPH|nr:unnamed protein product [Sepia pharaonis]